MTSSLPLPWAEARIVEEGFAGLYVIEENNSFQFGKQSDISDAILAKCYILNSDKYPIAEEQMLYGDVIGNNGINQQDALAIQQYAVGLIDTF